MLYRIKNTRTFEIDYISVFSELAIGTIIGWKSDKEQPDGIARWEVIECIDNNFKA